MVLFFMRIAIIGCGFVADYYLKALTAYPELKITGVMDIDKERAKRFAAFYRLAIYQTMEELLADTRVDLVLNLTNPHSHYSVSHACLEAGKHVYSEKPLAMVFSEAEQLVLLAEQKSLYITSAPCSLLGETAQTIWRALRQNAIGSVRLVYAEMDDGLIHRMRYNKWTTDSGAPWPYKDEFEVGCTIEHAGYYLTWLTAFFGPAKSVTSFARCLIPNKLTPVPLNVISPDFTLASIEFASGVVARLTCSIIAPHDHSLRIFGDEGVLSINECWNYRSPVNIKYRTKLSLWAEKYHFLSLLPGIAAKKLPLVRKKNTGDGYKGTDQMDFGRGVAEMANAISEMRPCRMSAKHALHVNELTLAIQYPEKMGCPRTLISSFGELEPMPWAL
ncbi:MAG: dehydrogenase [Nitrospirales bacterium]|nr:MAG: dehydrogenase [Nitrospirales bacterium]